MAFALVYAGLLQVLNGLLLATILVFEFALWRNEQQAASACLYFTVMIIPLYPLVALVDACVWCL